MIVFTLNCSQGHSFDEWFASGDEYERMAVGRELKCPTCGDTHVTKGLMAPAVSGSIGSEPAMPSSCSSGGCASGMCPWAAE